MTDAPRRAVVTGAAGGIGAATMSVLEREGMIVAGLDLESGERPGISVCDVTDAAAVRDGVAAAVERLGGLDVVVNVAGGSARSAGDGPVEECTDEAWDLALDLNLRSTFLVCRAALPHLGAGSSVVNTASVLGLRGGAPDMFDAHAYAAAKGGVIALTRAMAASYAARGIRVNAVAPGLVRTAMSARAQHRSELLEHVASRQPLVGPLLEPDQVAEAIGFLASSASAGITGVVLPVDGGWTAT